MFLLSGGKMSPNITPVRKLGGGSEPFPSFSTLPFLVYDDTRILNPTTLSTAAITWSVNQTTGGSMLEMASTTVRWPDSGGGQMFYVPNNAQIISPLPYIRGTIIEGTNGVDYLTGTFAGDILQGGTGGGVRSVMNTQMSLTMRRPNSVGQSTRVYVYVEYWNNASPIGSPDAAHKLDITWQR